MTRLGVETIQATTGNTISVQTPTYISSIGSPIQVIPMRTDNRDTWASPLSTGPVGGNPVRPLAMSITPKSASSLIYVRWMINGEVHWNNKWTILLNNSLCTINGWQGFNELATTGRWVGYVSGIYEAAGDVNSTMNHFKIDFLCRPNSIDTLTFTPAISASGATAYNFFLNRTAGALGQDSYENAVSTGVIMEIAQ
jgi:hypothetical protein